MKRKLFLGLGTVASVAAPIVAVVSCGDEVISGKMSWNRSDKEVVFNLSGDAPDGAFAAYGVDFDGLKALDADFATIVAQNNVLKLNEGDAVKATFFLGFKEIKNATPSASKDEDKTSIDAEVMHKIKVTVNFKYSTTHGMGKGTGVEDTGSVLTAPEYKGFKTNIVEVIAKALTATDGLGKTVALAKMAASVATEVAESGNTVGAKKSVQHFKMAAYGTAAAAGTVITEDQFNAIVVNYTAK